MGALASSDACGAETRRLLSHGGTEIIIVACGRRGREFGQRTPCFRVSIRSVFERRRHGLRQGEKGTRMVLLSSSDAGGFSRTRIGSAVRERTVCKGCTCLLHCQNTPARAVFLKLAPSGARLVCLITAEYRAGVHLGWWLLGVGRL